MPSQLHTKDPSRQELLEILLQSGFIRERIRESSDPTLVSQVSITKANVKVLVDLNDLMVRLSVGRHEHLIMVGQPMDVIDAIAISTNGAIQILVNQDPNLARYDLGNGRHTVQTKKFGLN